jgi:hypothetical protein
MQSHNAALVAALMFLGSMPSFALMQIDKPSPLAACDRYICSHPRS